MQILFNFHQLKAKKTVLRRLLWDEKIYVMHVLNQVLNEI